MIQGAAGAGGVIAGGAGEKGRCDALGGERLGNGTVDSDHAVRRGAGAAFSRFGGLYAGAGQHGGDLHRQSDRRGKAHPLHTHPLL